MTAVRDCGRRRRRRHARVPSRHEPDPTAARCSTATGNPGAALAAVRRGRRCTPVFRDESRVDAERGTASRVAGERAADPERVATALRARGTARARRRRATAYPIRDELPDRPSVLLVEGDGPTCWTARGSRSSAPAPARSTGSTTPASSARTWPAPASPSSAAWRSASTAPRTTVRSTAGGGAVGVLATGLDVVYPRRHVTLFDRVRRARPARERDRASACSRRRAVPGPQPHHRRPSPTWSSWSRRRCRAGRASPPSTRSSTAARCSPSRARAATRPRRAATRCIADGAHPLLEPDDVLVALGLTAGSRRGWARPRPGRRPPATPPASSARAVANRRASISSPGEPGSGSTRSRVRCATSSASAGSSRSGGGGGHGERLRPPRARRRRRGTGRGVVPARRLRRRRPELALPRRRARPRAHTPARSCSARSRHARATRSARRSRR